MKVRIGATKYDLVLEKDDLISEEGELCVGLINGDYGYLKVSSQCNEQCKKQTFWHEVVHGFFDELGQKELMFDEGIVDSLGKLLYAFHEDNKLEKLYEKLSG